MFSDVSGANTAPILQGDVGGLVESKLMSRIKSYGSSVLILPNNQHHHEDGDGVSTRNVGIHSHFDAVGCPWKFHWILSPPKLQDLLPVILVRFSKKCILNFVKICCQIFEKYSNFKFRENLLSDFRKNTQTLNFVKICFQIFEKNSNFKFRENLLADFRKIQILNFVKICCQIFEKIHRF